MSRFGTSISNARSYCGGTGRIPGRSIVCGLTTETSINFLGLGLHPPTADWALMISENRNGIAIQPWAVAVPAMLLALLTVSVNLVADGIARSLGRSVEGLARA